MSDIAFLKTKVQYPNPKPYTYRRGHLWHYAFTQDVEFTSTRIPVALLNENETLKFINPAKNITRRSMLLVLVGTEGHISKT